MEVYDKNRRFKNRITQLRQGDYLGQLHYIISVQFGTTSGRHGQSLLLAVIRAWSVESANGVPASRFRVLRNPGELCMIDAELIEGVIGRVYDPERRRWVAVERDGLFRRIRVIDEEEVEREAMMANAMRQS